MSWLDQYRRGKYANDRGWRSLGLLMRASWNKEPQATIDRILRYSNRLWRLNNGKSPWHPYKGF